MIVLNWYMNTGISNWHISRIEHMQMIVQTLFQFDTQLLTSN